MSKKYLFIRILEACNAGCFMCGFAHSTDPSRFTSEDLKEVLPAAKMMGVKFIRYTGGEPLTHEEIEDLVRLSSAEGLLVSLITNGYFLEEKTSLLVEAGLSQVIVSLDGASSETHDRFRKTEGLFDRAIRGIRKCREMGIAVRVNSVVGPHNYEEMVGLQTLLEKHGVSQWEVSALKLDRKIKYPRREAAIEVGKSIYEGNHTLIPMGVPWYGQTEKQRADYFDKGIPPRPLGDTCRVTQDVVYLNGKTAKLYVCSCLPHRLRVQDFNAHYTPGRIESEELERQRQWYYEHGPRVCTGCSATAAGYGSDAAPNDELADWAY